MILATLYLQKEKMSTKTNKDVFIKSFRRKPHIVPLAYYNFHRMWATREGLGVGDTASFKNEYFFE